MALFTVCSFEEEGKEGRNKRRKVRDSSHRNIVVGRSE